LKPVEGREQLEMDEATRQQLCGLGYLPCQ
jgi:hypothetical protein